MSGGADTLAGLLLIAVAGGVGIYLYNQNRTTVAVATPSASAVAVAAATSASDDAGPFSSAIFSIFGGAGGSVEKPKTKSLEAGPALPVYDPAYHAPGQIEEGPLSLFNPLATPAPVSTAGLKSDFLSGVSNIFGGLFGGTAAAATPAAALTPSSAQPLSTDVDTVARTLWGEARGQGQAGMEAVANVIMNRARKAPAYGWPATPAAVCKQRWQFSCWNSNDPNLPMLKKVTATNSQFRMAIAIAQKAVAGKLPDRTGGADHYYAQSIAAPSWAVGKKPTVRIGAHIFFKLVG